MRPPKKVEGSTVATPAPVVSIDRSPGTSEPLATHLLDLNAAAQFLGLTRWQVYRLIEAGEIPYVLVGKKFYVRRATLIRWAERAEQRKAG